MKRERHILNRFDKLWGTFLFVAGMMALSAQAVVTVAPGEMAQQSQWAQEHLLNSSNLPPFSFTYNGQSSSSLLPTWPRTETDTVLDANRTQHVITWTNDFLQITCVAVEYNDYPMVEWTVYFKNMGARSTPLLENIQGLDATFSRTSGSEFVLHGNKGDSTTPDSYEPFQITLSPSSANTFSPLSYSGKSSSGPKGWPYYNLQMPGGGMILAIGWPGEWASSFTRDSGNNLRIEAGQQLTHLVLEPGEKIRTPLIALMFWQGMDVMRSQNIWRHWYMAHEIPRIDGRPPEPVTQIQVGGNDINPLKAFLRVGIKPDICWRDAGGAYTWYPNYDGPYKGDDSWLNTGTWEVDPKRYPNGFKPFSDWIHAHGMKFLLWFEPERVGDPHSWLGVNHPEWLLPGEVHGKDANTSTDSNLHAINQGNTHGLILNEGNPAALKWLTNHIEGLIMSNGIDWYREDMNGDGPLPAWRNHDATNRQGITENFYVQGHLAYWDALLAMNPGLRIDSCASGGRRNDLETMRRAVPFTRSDFQFPSMPNVVDGNQCHTYGLSSWLPFQGSGCRYYDPYSFRSFYMAEFGMCEGPNAENTAAQQQAYAECKKVAPIMLNGDYYPLTSYSLDHNVWMAWQFDWPAKGEGMVQAFRRSNNDDSSKTFHLSGLDPSADYEVTNFDVKGVTRISGKELIKNGLTINIEHKPGSAVIVYRQMPFSKGKSSQ